MNIYCDNCRLRRAADEALYRPGGLDCPMCGGPMRARPGDIPPAPPGFEWFDHTFTPTQAARLVARVPAGSYHWADIQRKAPRAVGLYTRLMAEGRWRDETLEHGFYEHPVRFAVDGSLTHGLMRLIACRDSGRPFRAAVFAPEGFAGQHLVPP